MLDLIKKYNFNLKQFNWLEYKEIICKNRLVRQSYYLRELDNDNIEFRPIPEKNVDSYFLIILRKKSNNEVEVTFQSQAIFSFLIFLGYLVSIFFIINYFSGIVSEVSKTLNIILIILPIVQYILLYTYFRIRTMDLIKLFTRCVL